MGIRRARILQSLGWLLTASLLFAVLAISSSPVLAKSKPGTPSSVSVTRSDGTLNASWKAPAHAETYHITYSSDGGNSWSLAALNHPNNSITISGVDNSKSYIVGVRARNSGGDSDWRNILRHRAVQPAQASPTSPSHPQPPA